MTDPTNSSEGATRWWSTRQRSAQCKDCGSPDVAWAWERFKKPGSAGCRCHPCYLAYTRRRMTPALKVKVSRRPTASRYVPKLSTCPDCGSSFSRRNQGVRCGDCAALRRSAAEQRRRNAERAGDQGITWRTVGGRDGWRCHLCRKKVPQHAGTAHEPNGATVDHLVPISCGGAHSWDNVALAHRKCNLSRGDRGIVQLRLVG